MEAPTGPKKRLFKPKLEPSSPVAVGGGVDGGGVDGGGVGLPSKRRKKPKRGGEETEVLGLGESSTSSSSSSTACPLRPPSSPAATQTEWTECSTTQQLVVCDASYRNLGDLEQEEGEKRNEGIVAMKSSALVVLPPVMELTFSDGVPFKIGTINATFDTACTFDMRQLVTRAKNVEYNSKKYPSACFFKLKNPRLTGIVFVHGRVNLMGGKDLAQTRFAAKKLARLIQRCGYPELRFLNYRVEQILVTVDLGFPVRLSALAAQHRRSTTYEPEISASLFYRAPDKVSCTIQCWASGKVMITGAKQLEQAFEAYEFFRPIAEGFQM